MNDWDTALDVYRQAGAANKVVEALAAKGDFEQLATFTRSSGGYLWLCDAVRVVWRCVTGGKEAKQ